MASQMNKAEKTLVLMHTGADVVMKACILIIVTIFGAVLVKAGFIHGSNYLNTRLCVERSICKYADIDNNPEYAKAIEIGNHPWYYTLREVKAAEMKLDSRYQSVVVKE